MKKMLAMFTIMSLMLVSNTAFAQEDYELLVIFGSDPAETNIPNGEAELDVFVGDEITFTRKVVSIGMDTFIWDWDWVPEVLDCEPLPEFDSPDLVCTAIAEGESSVSYEVNATMDDQSTRVATSKIIYVTVHGDLPAVSDYHGHTNQTAIEHLYENEIVEGYPDGTFKPDNALTRAELMKILVLGAGYDPSEEEYNNCFPDVGDEWFARYVCFAYDNGWVEGYPDNEFKPGENVLKVEAVKMLLEIFNVTLIESTTIPYDDLVLDGWFLSYILTAYEMGLLEEEGLIYNPGNDITRAQVSENIYRLLMDEQERFDIAAEKTMCDFYYFGDNDIITTPLEEANPMLADNLEANGFNLDEEGAFDAITSRYSYTANEFLMDPEGVCEE